MTGRGAQLLTLLLAAVLGGAAAMWFMPRWQLARALEQIASEAHAERDAGWRWFLLARTSDGEMRRRMQTRAHDHLDSINRALRRADDPAVRDGAERLRTVDLWGWGHQPDEMILREIALRAVGDADEARLAAADLADAPLGLAADRGLPIIGRLFAHDEPVVRLAGLDAACRWLGRSRISAMENLDWPADDTVFLRRSHLAMSWADDPQPAEDDGEVEKADIAEAILLRRAMAHPREAEAIIAHMRAWGGDERPAYEYILARIADPQAREELERLADAGRSAARFALQARTRHVDEGQARRVVTDEREPTWRRRLAAWRWDRIEPEYMVDLLAADPTEPDGSVYAAALLAERRLSAATAGDLAASWLRSLDSDRKRAGALLTALLATPDADGDQTELLRAALEASREPPVRTALKIALGAIDPESVDVDPLEFAGRALRKEDGDFNPDTLLCLLAAGDVNAIDFVVSRPRGESRAAVQQRAILIERFLPHWHEDVGRPIGGDGRAILQHFDWLRARWLLESRRTAFDPASRTYAPGAGE